MAATHAPTATERIATGLYAGVLLTVLGGVAVATGEAFVFPSLGPSAFVLAVARTGDRTSSRRVVGGHAIGAVAGLAAYTVLAGDVALTPPPPPLSDDAVRLAASGVVSVTVTTWGMLATDTVHPPACATTLIVSLGLLATVPRVAFIVVAVVLLLAVHRAAMRLARGPLPWFVHGDGGA